MLQLLEAQNSEATQSQDSAWGKKFELLCNYHCNHGSSHVPYSYKVEGIKLGRLVAQQKCSCNMAKLTLERIDMLNSINFE